MNKKVKNIIITICFVAILIIIFILNIFVKDKEISETERRKLAQFPKVSFKNLFSGKLMDDFEEYTVDQFIGRDFFKSVKVTINNNILMQKDTNGLFEKDGAIYKIEYPLNKNNVNKTTDKINEVYEKYLKNVENVYYAIIPDKIYYLENDDHLKIDYNEIKDIMQKKLTELNYIDIWNCLSLNDYYKTDAHWKQENLIKVVLKLQKEMKMENAFNTSYIEEDKGEFYGGYYGQLGIKLNPDNLKILTNDTIQNCITYNYETEKYGKIYNKSNTSDKYDMFLEGAVPLISIENPNIEKGKELIIFRDSFGSSLAPLLVKNYKKITLVDLRYISSKILDEYIKFENQDVLFLYSTLVINQNVLK